MQGMLQQLCEPDVVLGVEVGVVLEGGQHEVFMLFRQSGIAVPHDNDTAARLHGYYCRTVLVSQKDGDTFVVVIVKDTVMLSGPYAHQAFQGLNVVGLGGGGMELGPTTSTGSHGDAAVMHILC